MLSLLSVAACAAHLPPCPRAGGAAWRELANSHLRLRTDLEEEPARTLLSSLAQLRAALLVVFHASPDLATGALPVIVVDRGWSDVADASLSGFFTRELFQPLLVMRNEANVAQEEDIKHELVHYFSSLIMPEQPRWLAEGLATYFQTLDYDAEKQQVTVGRPPADRLATVQQLGLLTLDEMAAMKTLDSDTGRFYASAWLTVHYLMNHQTQALARYEAALNRQEPFPDAWREAFGGLTGAELSEQVRRYMDGGQYALLTFRMPPVASDAVQARVLSDAEAHATRAELLVQGSRGMQREERVDRRPREEFRARARAELAEALRQDPAEVLGRAIAAFDLGETLDVAAARAATERQPSDWMAWLLLAKALEQHGVADGRAEATAKAAELAALDPSVTLAWK